MDNDFKERSYSGSMVRPRPECIYLKQENFLAIATPWGPTSAARDTIKTVTEFVSAHFRDPDATSPFPRIPALSEIANTVRIGALMANDSLVRVTNRSEYLAGVEFFAAMKKEREVSWIQVGQPHVILLRPGRSILTLSANIDLSMEYNIGSNDPLPSDCLGVQAIPPLFINSFRSQPGDQLLLLSYTWPPATLQALEESAWNLEGITKCLASFDNEQPFWIGLWKL